MVEILDDKTRATDRLLRVHLNDSLKTEKGDPDPTVIREYTVGRDWSDAEVLAFIKEVSLRDHEALAPPDGALKGEKFDLADVKAAQDVAAVEAVAAEPVVEVKP